VDLFFFCLLPPEVRINPFLISSPLRGEDYGGGETARRRGKYKKR